VLFRSKAKGKAKGKAKSNSGSSNDAGEKKKKEAPVKLKSNLAVRPCSANITKGADIAPVIELLLNPAKPRVGGTFTWEAQLKVGKVISDGVEMRMRAEHQGKKMGEDTILPLCGLLKCPVGSGVLTLATKKGMSVDKTTPTGVS
jgi:hypothetical protein